MSLRFYANAPATTLANSCTNVAGTMQVTSVTGYPIQFPFTIILDRGTATEEAVSVTAAAGTTYTITRAIDSTTAFAHSIGATVEHGITAQDIREPNAHINASSGVHGATGAVLGTSDAQVVTNKTIGTTNTINGFTASRFMEADGTGKIVSGTKVIPTGAVVGLSDAQALTNKDLTSGTNTFPTSLVTLTGSQALTNKDLTSGTNTFPTSLATLTGTQVLTNKDISSSTNTLPAHVSPVGSIHAFGGSAAPTGYLLCDGTSYLRASFPALFAVLGTAYGSVDGTHFNVPDMRGRVGAGYDSTQTEFNALGKTGGEKTHLLITAEMPSHSHTGLTAVNGDHTHGVWKSAAAGSQDGFNINTANTQSSWGGVVQNAGAHQHSITAEGGGTAHNVLQPYVAVNYIIRAA